MKKLKELLLVNDNKVVFTKFKEMVQESYNPGDSMHIFMKGKNIVFRVYDEDELMNSIELSPDGTWSGTIDEGVM